MRRVLMCVCIYSGSVECVFFRELFMGPSHAEKNVDDYYDASDKDWFDYYDRLTIDMFAVWSIRRHASVQMNMSQM